MSVKNKGEIQFRPVAQDEVAIRLVISYQLPDVLLPLADLLKPTVDGILLEYMNEFREGAVREQRARAESA